MTTESRDSQPAPAGTRRRVRSALYILLGLAALTLTACTAAGTGEPETGGHKSEFDLPLPDLHAATFFGGLSGWYLLLIGMVICLGGFGFGIYSYMRLKDLPVHQSMREVSELI